MRRLFGLVLLACSIGARAQESYLGLYIQGQKVGYSSFSDSATTLDGKPVKKSTSVTLFSTKMLGSALEMKILGTTWSDAKGRPIRMTFQIDSAGRSQKIDAAFGPKTVRLLIDNSGQKSQRVLDLPTGGQIVDDALGALLLEKVPVRGKREFYILDPTTASFVKNTVVVGGPTTCTLRGKSVPANLITVQDPRADTKVFLDSKGNFLKADGPMGIEMVPESKAIALSMKAPVAGDSGIDIAEWTSIKPDTVLQNPGGLSGLDILMSGHDLSAIPSDAHQTVKLQADGWFLSIHPNRWSEALNPTVASLKGTPKYLTPSLHIGCKDPEWRARVTEATKGATQLKPAVEGIHRYVFARMRPNAGIGVLRDASEVFKTREGVCRDYAILTATLMRAAGIPARLASGLVSWDGTFYYHAWVEVWDGRNWYPVDSTSPDIQVSAAHIKLSQGNVEDAFTFPFLGDVKIKVISTRR